MKKREPLNLVTLDSAAPLARSRSRQTSGRARGPGKPEVWRLRLQCGLACVLLPLLLAPPALAQQRGWRAGVAKAVITPKQPTWMSGYAGRDKPAEGKVHDLW